MFTPPKALDNLLKTGKTLRQLERETGIAHQRLSEYSRGIKRAPSEVREVLNQHWRSTNYNTLREYGLSATQARRVRDMSFEKTLEYKNLFSQTRDMLYNTITDREGNPLSQELIDKNLAMSKKDIEDYREYF